VWHDSFQRWHNTDAAPCAYTWEGHVPIRRAAEGLMAAHPEHGRVHLLVQTCVPVKLLCCMCCPACAVAACYLLLRLLVPHFASSTTDSRNRQLFSTRLATAKPLTPANRPAGWKQHAEFD
jgi:hypothetical protein